MIGEEMIEITENIHDAKQGRINRVLITPAA